MSKKLVLNMLVLALLLSGCTGYPSLVQQVRQMIFGEDEAPVDVPEPPAAILTIGDRQQNGRTGTYCWSGGFGQPAVCADMLGIPTVLEPIVVNSPLTAQFELLHPQAPGDLVLEVFPVTETDQVGEIPTARLWQPKPGQRHPLQPQTPSEVDLELEPGLYVFSLMGRWQDPGSANYGFLVQVE